MKNQPLNIPAAQRGQPRGAALVVAMCVVLFLGAMCAVLMTEISSRAERVAVDQEDLLAFEAAEAGIDAALNDINQCPTIPLREKDPSTGLRTGPQVKTENGRPISVHDPARKPGCLGTRNWRAATMSGSTVTYNDDLLPAGGRGAGYISRPTWRSTLQTSAAGGARIYYEPNIVPQSIGDVAFFTYAIDWLYDGIDNDGNGSVDDTSERNKYTVFSTGIHRGLVKSGVTESGRVVTIQVVAQAKDKDIPALPSGPLELQIAPRN